VQRDRGDDSRYLNQAASTNQAQDSSEPITRREYLMLHVELQERVGIARLSKTDIEAPREDCNFTAS